MKVVIIGGGIAGLSAATLLSEHPNMEIEIYEKEERLGGQAASMFNSNCSIEHCWRVFAINYHNLWNIFKHKLNIVDNFTPWTNLCILDNEVSQQYNRFVFSSYFPTFFKEVKFKHYYKYFDFLFLAKERVVQSYDHINAINYFDKNKFVELLIGPILGLEFVKTSISGSFKNLYHLMDSKKYDFSPTISQVTKNPTNEAVFVPWEKYLLNNNVSIHKSHALEDIIIEENQIKYVVLNSKKVYADEFIFTCSLKPINHILEKKPPCETFKNMKQLEQNLQLYFAFNMYFKKKLNINCDSIALKEEPWYPVIQRKPYWSSEIIKSCTFNKNQVEEVWNIAIVDFRKGKKIQKKARECSLEEAVEETLFQVKHNKVILKMMQDNQVTFEEVYLGHDIWYQYVNSTETFPLHHSSHSNSNTKLADLSPKYSPNQGTMKYIPKTHPDDIPENMTLGGYYVYNTYGGASMESSCETGLTAADYILQKHKIPNQTILPIKHTNKYLTPVPLFKPFIKLDEILYENKLDPITKYVNSFYLLLSTLLVCIILVCFLLYKGVMLLRMHMSIPSTIQRKVIPRPLKTLKSKSKYKFR